jgi:hypothetical protein
MLPVAARTAAALQDIRLVRRLSGDWPRHAQAVRSDNAAGTQIGDRSGIVSQPRQDTVGVLAEVRRGAQ